VFVLKILLIHCPSYVVSPTYLGTSPFPLSGGIVCSAVFGNRSSPILLKYPYHTSWRFLLLLLRFPIDRLFV
jgi:hypothetical protein